MCGAISTEVFRNADSRSSIATLLGAAMLAFGIRDPSAHCQQEQSLPLVNQKPSWGIAGCWFLQGLPSTRRATAQGNTKVLPRPQIRPPDPQIPGTQHLCSDSEQDGMAPPAPPRWSREVMQEASSPLRRQREILETQWGQTAHSRNTSLVLKLYLIV